MTIFGIGNSAYSPIPDPTSEIEEDDVILRYAKRKKSSDWYSEYCDHEACDTGFRDTWCKKCNVDMEFVDGFAKVKVPKE